MANSLLSKASTNYKTRKSLKSGEFDGAILYMAPWKESGLGNVCPYASLGCRSSCLYTAGLGVFSTVKQGRIRKTRLFLQDKPLFFKTLYNEVEALRKKCEKSKKTAFVRLNGTSDINYGNFKIYNGKNIFQAFPTVNFYDYTKDFKKLIANREPNYVLTFSLSESNREQAFKALEAGFNISAVFLGKELPKTYMGYKVYDGDKEDLQFLYPKGVIIGLRAKGKARYDTTGFAIDLQAKVLEKTA